MSKKTKSFIYNLIAFAILFFPVRYLITYYTTGITGLFIPLTAFVVATILAPKFQAVNTSDGEKIYMKWIFLKGVKEIK